MKKILFVAHVDSHIRHFHIPYLKYFKEKGYEVHVATSNDENEEFPYCDVKHSIPFERNPFKWNNIVAVKQMKKLLDEEKFDIVHCHTPMGGVDTRLACRKTRKACTKIIYTAHGFHFYKGAPIKNWILFYPMEKYLSRVTDILVTINHEDYNLAKSRFYAKETFMIHGVGVDDKKFNELPLDNQEANSLKSELKINDNDFNIAYVAELIPRKNQIMLIEAMRKITAEYPNIKLYLIGKGILTDYYHEKIKQYNLENNVYMLGYRTDVNKIFKVMDLCISTSKQEGLGLNLVEAALSRSTAIS